MERSEGRRRSLDIHLSGPDLFCVRTTDVPSARWKEMNTLEIHDSTVVLGQPLSNGEEDPFRLFPYFFLCLGGDILRPEASIVLDY